MKNYKWTSATKLEVTIAEGAAKGIYPTTAFDFADGLLDLGYRDIAGKRTHLRIRVADMGNLESEINEQVAAHRAAATSPEAIAAAQKEIDYMENMARAGFSSGNRFLDNLYGFRGDNH